MLGLRRSRRRILQALQQPEAMPLPLCLPRDAVACRYGGDEFVILLTEVSHASDAVLVVDKVIAKLGAPSRVGDRETVFFDA